MFEEHRFLFEFRFLLFFSDSWWGGVDSTCGSNRFPYITDYLAAPQPKQCTFKYTHVEYLIIVQKDNNLT